MSSRFRRATPAIICCRRIWPCSRRRATSRRSKPAARRSKRSERERREQQAALLKKLEGVEVTLERRANEQGHLFGSVSATDIAKALQAQGYNVEPDDINLPGKLDRIEKYTVQVKFAEDLETDVKVWVAPDPESKAAIDAAQKARAAETAEQA